MIIIKSLCEYSAGKVPYQTLYLAFGALCSEIFSVSVFMMSCKGCCPLTRRTFRHERVEINRSNFVVPTVANTCPDAILGCIAKACGLGGMA
jgi:hypothetical protein